MRNPVSVLLLLILPLGLAWADRVKVPSAIEGATTLTAEQVIKLLLNEPRLVIIDSRKQKEYLKGHIEGAVNLPDIRMSADMLARFAADSSTPLLFYCNGIHCKRSSNAITKAQQWGYHQLYWFRGGWLEWREKKLPIAR